MRRTPVLRRPFEVVYGELRILPERETVVFFNSLLILVEVRTGSAAIVVGITDVG